MQEKELFDEQRRSADVIILDGLPPEEGAMSQALYSRVPQSILSHLKKIREKGAESFMSTWYSGYGHNSIGDCGSTTLYFENVSMLAAKAVQNWSLYNGQEASTRYLDFTGRKIINPLGGLDNTYFVYIPRESLINGESVAHTFIPFTSSTANNFSAGEKGKRIQEQWMAFYEKHMPLVKEYVRKLNPKKDEESPQQYEKAVSARAFDIMRAFIPAGMTTLVSWHSNVRQLRDHLDILKYHPSEEVARIAATAIGGLKATYPASFNKKDYVATEEYLKLRASQTSYFQSPLSDFSIDDSMFKEDRIRYYADLLKNRPPKTEVPHEAGEAGTIHISFPIDFGSFRDVQRHRKGVCKMPLLTTTLGFHPWYLERLPEESRIEAETLIKELVLEINSLPCSAIDKQYYIPMGFQVYADFTWTIDQCFYVAELRSSETVHATLRVIAQKIGKWLQKKIPHAALHIDWSEDKWSYKRGSQDIVEKSV
ncbi:MAG TPA: FAD-dependent thymidylate synthase [Candidatus Paceibacterota bacterium]